jgi:hypothetical protein
MYEETWVDSFAQLYSTAVEGKHGDVDNIRKTMEIIYEEVFEALWK